MKFLCERSILVYGEELGGFITFLRDGEFSTARLKTVVKGEKLTKSRSFILKFIRGGNVLVRGRGYGGNGKEANSFTKFLRDRKISSVKFKTVLKREGGRSAP